MDQRSFIASRIDVQLRRHLGQSVDTHRAVADARYAKDLLLVCDAKLGGQVRQVGARHRVAEELFQAARRALAPRAPARGAADAPPPQRERGSTIAQRLMSFARALKRLQTALKRSSSAPSATWSPTP
jgi:hypothetical protein